MNLSQEHIFISFAPTDYSLVSQLGTALERDGYPICHRDLDSEKSPNDSLLIVGKVDSARALIILLTPSSINDENVKREINLGIEKKKTLYPIYLSSNEDLKQILTPEWRYWLGITQILTCSDINEAAQILRFRIPADAASEFSDSPHSRELIKGAWRSFESIFREVSEAKMKHFYLDFDSIHEKFLSQVAPGFLQYVQPFKSSSDDLKVKNRFAGKMVYGLFNFIQYFDCHSLSVNRLNNCGLRGHDIETLVANYIEISALHFQYPSAIIWLIETQFLWNYESFLEKGLSLLGDEGFPVAIRILNLDFERLYSSYKVDDAMIEGLDYSPQVGLNEHVIDYLSRCMFYRSAVAISSKSVTLEEAERTLNSIDLYLSKYASGTLDLDSSAFLRQRFQMEGLPLLFALRAYLFKFQGNNVEATSALMGIRKADFETLIYTLPQKIAAANGKGKLIMEQLWEFIQSSRELDSLGMESPSEAFENFDFDYQVAPGYSVAEQLFLLGIRFDDMGDSLKAMDFWARAAKAGVFSALGSYMWTCLKLGKFDLGIKLFEECIDKPSDPIYEMEKLNCKGNYILNLLARDNDSDSAIKQFISLLSEPMSESFSEGKLSLATLEYLFGDKNRALKAFNSIPKDDLEKLDQLYAKEVFSSSGWLKNWCEKTMTVISELSKI